MNLRRWLIVGVVVVVALVVGGPYFYTHVIEGKAPKKLTLSQSKNTATTTANANGASAPLDGTWKATTGSQAGYRVNEVLFGQKHVAVGRTSNVTGQLTINGSTVDASPFTVDMTTVTSDQDRRDRQFQGRIMDTSQFPTATFKLSEPIKLASAPADGQTVSMDVPGDLTMHGATKEVKVHLDARRTGNAIEVSGSVPVTFADWNIPNPSFGGVVTTEDHGTMEFLVKFAHA
jgi:polyisoprenoid-binding protein YceI